MMIRGSDAQIGRFERAKEIYRRRVLPQLQEEDPAKIVLIDVVSEDFEINSDDLEACNKLKSRHPDATIVGFRLGIKPVDYFHSIRVVE